VTGKVLRHHARAADVQALLEVDRNGSPRCRDAAAVLAAIGWLDRATGVDVVNELLTRTLLNDSEERYSEHVAPLMQPIGLAQFSMGTAPGSASHFCGETPEHTVTLSPFAIAAVPVTNALYGLLDPDYLNVPSRERFKPAVDVTWFQAELFALWIGCRLPTEAEWEFACGGGARTDWCCASEHELPRYAWFSENSGGRVHPVATLEPNALGLFDLHGNVWEWCTDAYDQDYYASSPAIDPVGRGQEAGTIDRVCRGGCMYSFAEMCRTRYRFHEPAQFWASDLGFRLARSIDSPTDWR
jgi:formylglycine-generating enzyme required for sulfatase activity